MIKTYKVRGVVLRQINLGEADRLLTVFTNEQGKLKLIAKGVRKTTSRKRGHLELLAHVNLVCVKAKNLDLIIEASTINAFSYLRQNLNRVRIAYLFTELVNDLTAENQAHPEIYHLLLKSLSQLDSPSAPKNLIVNFETELLELLGFGLPPRHDRQGLEDYISSLTEEPINSKKIK